VGGRGLMCARGVARGVMVAVVAGLLLLPSSALAARKPTFASAAENELRVYPTRVHFQVTVFGELLALQTTAGYAPAEPDGEAPPENSAAWKVVTEEEFAPSNGRSSIDLGAPDPGMRENLAASAYLRHLLPDTSYYARFTAKNKEGTAVEKLPFKTLALAKPEMTPLFPTIPPGSHVFFEGGAESATSAGFELMVESNGSETSYSVDYSLPENGHAPAVGSASWKPFTSNAAGTITPAAEYAQFKTQVTGLTPETTYYVRLKATNAVGELIQNTYATGQAAGNQNEEVSTFTTLTAKPGAGEPSVRNVTTASAHIIGPVSPHGSETAWRLESASSPSGPWTAIPGATGTISKVRAEATPYGDGIRVGGSLGGLAPSTPYYVRLFAECAEGCGSATSPVASFETSGAPTATTFMVHALEGESLRLLGGVNPNSEPTTAEQVVTLEGAGGGTFTLTFKGQTTVPIAYNASPGTVEEALGGLEGTPRVLVEGGPGGPYTVWFFGGNVSGAQPPIEAGGLGLIPPGTVSVVTTQQGGESYDTHYRFRYVSQKSFEEHGWAQAQETGELDARSGTSLQIVGGDLPSLTPGETYRYRLVASSTAPGTGLVEGGEQTFTAPTPATVGGGETGLCPNEAFRTGVSAHLPDCRAYEMLTPADKEGAQELFDYLGGISHSLLISEDGEHAALEATEVNWGKGPGSGQSPYFFSRQEGVGWLMTAGTPQRETGVYGNAPQLYSADRLTVAFASSYRTSPGNNSAQQEFKVGPAGGPYKTVASAPSTSVSSWVAGNGDLSKLVFSTTDHTLLGEEPTGTKSGADLYEYTASGGLRQLNVAGEAGTTIGRCGARMVMGQETPETYHSASTSHSVSADGSRVFFEAAPGSSCSEPAHLYMRVNGSETVDVGSYEFMGANAQGTTLLLKDGAGNLVGYDVESKATQPEPGGEQAVAAELAQVGIPDRTEPNGSNAFYHPRYSYFGGTAGGGSELNEPPVLGLPGGAVEVLPGGALGSHRSAQVYRYDSVEHVVECISCASSFDREPGLPAFLNSDSSPGAHGGPPDYTAMSGDGRFAFFTTPAALVPQDINGEIPVETELTFKSGHGNGDNINDGGRTSPSSDVYEWRADGVDGCVQLQGCLALITDGRGGYQNLLLGTANEGRDVFVYTRSKLVAQDTDTSGDVYDVRIGGGFPPAAPRPTECEADACSTPPIPPNDATPSSSTFHGAGNLLAGALPEVKPKPKPKHKPKKKAKRRKKGRKAGKAGGKRRAKR
jgi:hypothetical protein